MAGDYAVKPLNFRWKSSPSARRGPLLFPKPGNPYHLGAANQAHSRLNLLLTCAGEDMPAPAKANPEADTLSQTDVSASNLSAVPAGPGAALDADSDRLPLGLCWAIWLALSLGLWGLLLSPFLS